jgi:hypothetical protein
MLFVLIPSLWLTTAALVVAMCRMASRADALPAGGAACGVDAAPTDLAHRSGEAIQSPRRPITCGTVRRRILTSVQSDQLATYR